MNKNIRGGYYSLYKFSLLIQVKWKLENWFFVRLHVEKMDQLFTINVDNY